MNNPDTSPKPDTVEQPANEGLDVTSCSPSFSPETDSLADEIYARGIRVSEIRMLQHARKLERQRTRLLRIAESYIDDLDDSGDEAGAKGIRRWVQDILSENVQVEASPPEPK